MAWTSLTFAFASSLTSTKMTQLYDNAGGEVSAGNYIVMKSLGVAHSSGSYTKNLEFEAFKAGIYRVRLGIAVVGATTTTVAGRIYVNGVAVGTIRTMGSETMQFWNEDIAVVTGDLIQIYTVRQSGIESVISRAAIMTVVPIPGGELYSLDADWV